MSYSSHMIRVFVENTKVKKIRVVMLTVKESLYIRIQTGLSLVLSKTTRSMGWFRLVMLILNAKTWVKWKTDFGIEKNLPISGK